MAAALVVALVSATQYAPLSSGEANFLWWFSQGSIMDVQVRRTLRGAWGMCDRHTAAWLTVEAAFRQGFMHGPAVMYTDLMERALRVFNVADRLSARRLARRLQSRSPCHVCAMGLGPNSEGYVPKDRLKVGRDLSQIRRFMEEASGFWHETLCGRCAEILAEGRCRMHLCADIQRGNLDGLEQSREMVRRIAHHIGRYHESFRWESHGTDTAADRGALISAAGWCGGWRGLLSAYGVGQRTGGAE